MSLSHNSPPSTPVSSKDSALSISCMSSEKDFAPEYYLSANDLDLEANTHTLSRRASIIPSIDKQNAISRILTEGATPDPYSDIPPMGANRPLPPSLDDPKQYQVDFTGPDDPFHPFNWPFKRKLIIAAILSFYSLTAAWGSSVFSPAISVIARQYHVNSTVAALGISLYVVGFASGPVIWSPLSEVYGRKLPIALSSILFTCFCFATATGKDLQTILITRFFSGFCGSAPLTIVAAAFADIFDNKTRGVAIDIFSITVFCGPVIAPIVGGFIVESYLGWHWTMYLTGIMSFTSIITVIFFLDETYPPLLLVSKAEKLRRMTGNWAIHAAHETVKLDFNQIVTKTITRPLKMLVSEPIILLISIYTGFCYAILYLCLSSYPYVFMVKYKWSLSHAMLPYVGILIGMAICCTVMMTVYERQYFALVEKSENGRPSPEARLEPMKPAAICFFIGLFWFFWSANYPEHVHWAVPAVSGIFTGYGMMGIFVPAVNYVIDAYLFFAASALAAMTFLRSAMGAASPLFATHMFKGMGLNWTGLLLGLLATFLAPVPFLFSHYGERIRNKSKFSL